MVGGCIAVLNVTAGKRGLLAREKAIIRVQKYGAGYWRGGDDEKKF